VKPTDAERDAAFDRLITRGLAGAADASGVACPDADLLAAWFDHSLSSAEADRVEAHASSCSHCQQILGDLARSEPAITRAAPLPAPARPWHWHWRWLVPLATAAIVIVVAQRTLRAPGETPGVAPTQPGVAQPTSTVAETRQQAAPGRSAGEMADAVRPAGQAARQNAVAQKAVPEPSLARRREGEPAKPAPAAPVPVAEEARAEARPVGGIVGGVVGGVSNGGGGNAAKGRAEAQAESIAAAVPAQAPTVTMRAAASAKFETAARDAAVLVHSTSGAGPSGATASWRFGQAGLIERSADGGRTWQRQESGVTTPLADGSAATDLVCWLVGASGVVLRTTDGRTWQRIPPPTSDDLVSVHAWSESVATVTAADRTAYETADGGKTWRKREPGAALLP
jgi:hypothetical protein